MKVSTQSKLGLLMQKCNFCGDWGEYYYRAAKDRNKEIVMWIINNYEMSNKFGYYTFAYYPLKWVRDPGLN